MPPWWVHQKTGAERPASGRSFWFRVLWVSCQTLAITLHRIYCLAAHLSGASYVLRDGVEPASFPSWLGFHHSPVYPAGVRGVDLSIKGADMILMSLNGIKLVVTWLASPARIRLRLLVPSRYLHELEYRSPVILSRGFCTSVA